MTAIRGAQGVGLGGGEMSASPCYGAPANSCANPPNRRSAPVGRQCHVSHTACRTHHGISALSHIAAGAALMCCAHYEEHCSVRFTDHRDSANRGNAPAATVVGSLSAETEKRASIEMTSAFCLLTLRSLHFTSFTACDAGRACPKKSRKAEAQRGPGGN